MNFNLPNTTQILVEFLKVSFFEFIFSSWEAWEKIGT